MIAKLRGLIDTIGEDYLIIDVNGVGYLVFASTRALSKLDRNQTASLYIETIVREDSISLYGFVDPLEKEWFITLTKVQGVGSKVCLNILSVLSPLQIAQAIAAADKASFSRANGVGPKLAARLVTELKDKIVTVPIADTSLEGKAKISDEETILQKVDMDNNYMEDTLSALVNLGYQRIEAYRVINLVFKDNPNASTSELIRLSLKELGKEK